MMILSTQTRFYGRVGLAAGLLGLAITLAWPRSVHAESLEPVTLQLKWKHQFQFAFGVGTSELALWRARGQPVVALAVIFQHSPQILLARYEANQMQQLIQPVLVDYLAFYDPLTDLPTGRCFSTVWVRRWRTAGGLRNRLPCSCWI